MENEIEAADFAAQTHYVPRRRSGDDKIPGLHGKRLVDYWSWAYSDIMENVQRAIYAEFLVACALGLDQGFRVGWLSYDLKYGEKRIEVKSSAYLQTWYREQPSNISFSVAKRLEIDEVAAGFGKTPARYADVWVFCLFEPKKHGPSVDVLNADLWSFYVVRKDTLEPAIGDARSASLATVAKLTEPKPYKPVTYAQLKGEIDFALRVSSSKASPEASGSNEI